ncbi:MAG: tetratricopeptide repeat protein [Deltaproteobacteria bacterium]|nr:tetratricopeptide repeat protein [Deltaproteobacteria bacterium]
MEPDIRYWFEQGKEFFKNQAYRRAEGILLRIVGSKHEFADVYNMLGVIYHQTGRFEDAISSFEKALKLNPRYTEAMLNLSVLYNDMGEYKLSKKLLDRSKKEAHKSGNDIDPFIKGKLANKHAEVGEIYRGLGLPARAALEFGKALDLCPNFHDIRAKLAVALREEGKKEQALKELQRIVREKADYAEAHIQLGITLYSMGRKKEARLTWEKIAKKQPNHQLVKIYLRLSEDHKKKK